MNHRYFGMKRLGKRAGLPACRRDARIDNIKMQKIIDIFSDMGFTTDLVKDGSNSDLSNYKFVFVVRNNTHSAC